MTKKVRYCLLSSLLIAVLILSGIGIYRLASPSDDRNASGYPIKEIPLESQTGNESAIIPPWEEMTNGMRFPYLFYEGIEYSGGNIIPKGKTYLGGALGKVSVSAEDLQSGKTYTEEATVHTITGVSTECSLALCFANDENAYVYNNSLYRPETLSDLVTDLNLESYLSFGYIYDEQSSDNVRFEYDSAVFLWQMLLIDNLSAKAVDVTAEETFAGRLLSVAIDIPVLGYRNISLAVTKEGYLSTNILNTGKSFYIGKEKVDAFVSYVKENCDGYRIVYIGGTDPIPE